MDNLRIRAEVVSEEECQIQQAHAAAALAAIRPANKYRDELLKAEA